MYHHLNPHPQRLFQQLLLLEKPAHQGMVQGACARSALALLPKPSHARKIEQRKQNVVMFGPPQGFVPEFRSTGYMRSPPIVRIKRQITRIPSNAWAIAIEAKSLLVLNEYLFSHGEAPFSTTPKTLEHKGNSCLAYLLWEGG